MATTINLKQGINLTRVGESLETPYSSLPSADYSTNFGGSGFHMFWDGDDKIMAGYQGLNSLFYQYSITANKWMKHPSGFSGNWYTNAPAHSLYYDEVNDRTVHKSESYHQYHDNTAYLFNQNITNDTTQLAFSNNLINLSGLRTTTGSYTDRVYVYRSGVDMRYFSKSLGTWTTHASTSQTTNDGMIFWLPDHDPDALYLIGRAGGSLSYKGIHVWKFDIATATWSQLTTGNGIPFDPFYDANQVWYPTIHASMSSSGDKVYVFLTKSEETRESGVYTNYPVYEIDIPAIEAGTATKNKMLFTVEPYWGTQTVNPAAKGDMGQMASNICVAEMDGVPYMYVYFKNPATNSPDYYQGKFTRYILY